MVNGGTRGLGGEIAVQIVEMEERVIITGCTKHQGDEVVEKIETSKAIFVQMDCTTVDDEVIALYEKIVANHDFGGFDFAINKNYQTA
jgi:NAD(P)-dependent dehydrogenase (short-subunit alcohol dehydrogenase family)